MPRAVAGGLLAMLLWSGAAYLPFFFVKDWGDILDFANTWFWFVLVIPSLLISGATAATLSKERWTFASILTGALGGVLLSASTEGISDLWWTIPIVLVFTASIALVGGYLALQVLHYARR